MLSQLKAILAYFYQGASMLKTPIPLINESGESDYSWFEYCLNEYEELLKLELSKKHISQPIDQDTWDINNPYTTLKNHKLNEDKKDKDKIENNEVSIYEGMDILAWYIPKHSSTTKHGIYLPATGIVRLADRLNAIGKSESLEISRDIAVLWAATILYSHELIHGWIEYLVTKVEKAEKCYHYPNVEKSASLMEEAICNTGVYGFHGKLSYITDDIQNTPYQLKATSAKTAEWDKNTSALYILSRFMRGQPQGYRDFSEIDNNPFQDHKFIANIYLLMTQIYKCDDIASINALEEFFGFHYGVLLKYEPDKFIKAFTNSTTDYKLDLKSYFVLPENHHDIKHIGESIEGSHYICNFNGNLKEYKLPKNINGNLYFINCNISLSGIHEQVFSITGNIILIDTAITGSILGILKIADIKNIECKSKDDNTNQGIKIVNTFLKGNRNVNECRKELIAKDLGEFARL